jgi:hypothetical protein
VKAKPPASFSSFAPGAMTLSTARSGTFTLQRQIIPKSKINGNLNFMQSNLRRLKTSSDLKNANWVPI